MAKIDWVKHASILGDSGSSTCYLRLDFPEQIRIGRINDLLQEIASQPEQLILPKDDGRKWLYKTESDTKI